ncbi:hypothetical protein DEO72_LG10g3675 [Vigna unguiculata]|uniref:Trafficking protein particle complex subunit 2-like protein n=1 Tax=Vigna unguiculata TaxID=3917 RepID=A0A4D6NHH2_VIGUN|nr:hypothetical protein DEO72_LG10g3675 [Vigna unguiculata]
MIVCVAVVGHQNNPLYIQSFTEADDALKLHHIVHCSLDVVDERVNNPKRSGPMLNETFLGLLYPIENYKVYGYLTNTKVKFILVTTDLDVKDADNLVLFGTIIKVGVTGNRKGGSGLLTRNGDEGKCKEGGP